MGAVGRSAEMEELQELIERVVAPKGIQVRIVTRQCPILGFMAIARSRCAMAAACFAPLGVGDSQHVKGMVVIGVLVSHQVEVRNRLVVFPAVDGDGRGVEALVDRLR